MAVRKKASGKTTTKTRRVAASAANETKPASLPGEVTADTPLKVHDRIQIEWGGSWWQGSVVGLQDNGDVRIHYDGYDSSWDETIPRSRLWLPGTTPRGGAAAGGGGGGGAAGGGGGSPGPVESDPIRAVLTMQPVTDKSRLKANDAVQVEWGGRWWAGKVLAFEEDGRVRIHYEGWDSSWDETVPRTRLAIAASGPRRLSVVLDNAQTVTGTLLSSAGEFLVLLREDSPVRSLVNKQRILYIDVRDDE